MSHLVKFCMTFALPRQVVHCHKPPYSGIPGDNGCFGLAGSWIFRDCQRCNCNGWSVNWIFWSVSNLSHLIRSFEDKCSCRCEGAWAGWQANCRMLGFKVFPPIPKSFQRCKGKMIADKVTFPDQTNYKALPSGIESSDFEVDPLKGPNLITTSCGWSTGTVWLLLEHLEHQSMALDVRSDISVLPDLLSSLDHYLVWHVSVLLKSVLASTFQK